MRVALANLDTYRPTVGAMALGMGGRALSLALDFVKQREMFEKAGRFPGDSVQACPDESTF